MGYHVYNLSEFNLSALGRHRSYLFLFTQNQDAQLGFAEQIGEKSVSITNGINDVDWLFAADRPEWASPHAIYYASIVVICPRKTDAEVFLKAFKHLQAWYEGLSEIAESPPDPPVAVTSFNEYAIVAIPRTGNPMFASLDRSGRTDEHIQLHDSVLSVIAQLVQTGFARKAISDGRFSLLRERIQTITNIDTHLYRNTVLVDTLGHSTVPLRERQKNVYEELFDELRSIKEVLTAIPQTSETNDLLRELSKLRKAIRQERADLMGWRDKDEKSAIAIQASVGFELFGNGVKAVFDSNGLSTSPLARIASLFKRLTRLRDNADDTNRSKVEEQTQ